MGEKPVRGLKKAAPLTSMKRVKVYQIKDNGKWDDQGTGHVSIECIEGLSEVVLAVVDEDDKILLLHDITPDDIYQKQETIISWSDEGSPRQCPWLMDLRSGKMGMLVTSSADKQEQGDLPRFGPSYRAEEAPNSALKYVEVSLDSHSNDKSLSSVNDGSKELSPLEFFSSKRRKYSQHLPSSEFSFSSLLAI